MARSADEATVVEAEAVLLAWLVSVVVLDTVAVSVIVEPLAAEGATRTTIDSVAVAPLASVPPVQETVPVLPAAGAVQVKPAGVVSETKVTLVGRVSLIDTPVAWLGPLVVSG